MLTVFSTPRAFRGDMARIQRNAVRSWIALYPRPEILMFGDEAGTAEACAEFGLGHIRSLLTSKTGAPVLSDLFQTAQRVARHEILCYVNADIILTPDLIRVIEIVDPGRWGGLVICAPVDMTVEEEIDTDRPGWEEALRARARRGGRRPTPYGADVFLFPRGYYATIPPFFLGRGRWDNWLIAQGYKDQKGIDATKYCLAIHQRHGASSHIRPLDTENEEFKFNASLLGPDDRGWRSALPYELSASGQLRRKFSILTILDRVKDRVLGSPLPSRTIRP